MKKVFCALAVISAGVLLSATAVAQQEGGSGKGNMMRSACKADVQQFCSDVQRGGGRIINCLFDHYKEVSDNCYAVLKKIDARRNGGGNDAPPSSQRNDNGNGQ